MNSQQPGYHEAVTALCRLTTMAGLGSWAPEKVAALVLGIAGPAIRADEKEQIAKLAEQHHVRYQISACVCGDPEHWRSFADLLREPGEQP